MSLVNIVLTIFMLSEEIQSRILWLLVAYAYIVGFYSVFYSRYFAIPKLKAKLGRPYYQFVADRRRPQTGPFQTQGSQARPGASKPARDFTFGIQERRQALGS